MAPKIKLTITPTSQGTHQLEFTRTSSNVLRGAMKTFTSRAPADRRGGSGSGEGCGVGAYIGGGVLITLLTFECSKSYVILPFAQQPCHFFLPKCCQPAALTGQTLPFSSRIVRRDRLPGPLAES